MTTLPIFLAYLDPGVGSMLLQIAAAAILSVTVFCRHYILSPFAYVLGRRKSTPENE